VDLPVKRARFVTTVSEAAKRDLLSHTCCDPKKIVVIHNPISEEFLHRPKEFNRFNPRILQVGTASNKNVPRLVRSLEGIACKLVIIGALSEELRALLQQYQIRYENHTNLSLGEVVKQYELADLVTLASTIEGFGLPILEANAIGRPIVTSNISSMPEVAGDAACLVDPLDVASIRAGILRVVEDENYRDGLISKGLENVRRFRADAIAAEYLRLYREVAGEDEPSIKDLQSSVLSIH
jgi:glycosyltransferase involved in cell wall biosynthesis